jgi:hypothetical protein
MFHPPIPVNDDLARAPQRANHKTAFRNTLVRVNVPRRPRESG